MLTGGAEAVRKTEQVDHPVHHPGLDLGDGGAAGPAHALHAQAGRDQFGEDRRVGGVRREPGEEARMLPVGEARHHHPVEVGQHGIEAVGCAGSFRQQRRHLAGLDRRLHR